MFISDSDIAMVDEHTLEVRTFYILLLLIVYYNKIGRNSYKVDLFFLLNY